MRRRPMIVRKAGGMMTAWFYIYTSGRPMFLRRDGSGGMHFDFDQGFEYAVIVADICLNSLFMQWKAMLFSLIYSDIYNFGVRK